MERGNFTNHVRDATDTSIQTSTGITGCEFEKTWHIVSGVWNGTNSTLNGNERFSVKGNLDLLPLACSRAQCLADDTDKTHLSFDIAINSGGETQNTHFDGRIAAILVYNTALASEEVLPSRQR